MWIKEYDSGHEVLVNLDLVRALTTADVEAKEDEGDTSKTLVYNEKGEREKKINYIIIFINFEKDPTFLTYGTKEERDRVWERLKNIILKQSGAIPNE